MASRKRKIAKLPEAVVEEKAITYNNGVEEKAPAYNNGEEEATIAPIAPAIEAEILEESPQPPEEEEGLFDDAPPIEEVQDTPSEALIPTSSPEVCLPLPTDDLTQSQKLEFIRLVQKEMSIPERAKRLAALARLKGTKTAAVGLRAIQLMMEVEGWKDEQGQEAPPIFNLPDGVSVSVKVEPSRK